MRLIKILTATCLALALTACGALTPSVAPSDHPRLDAPDTANTQDCKDPVALPPGPMSRGVVEKLWGEDRYNLVDCGLRHRGSNDYIQERDARLVGK